MSEEIKGIKFFRKVSEVDGDVTLNGSLGANDVDNNFYYLREMLISSAYTAEYSIEQESGEIEKSAELVLLRVNGKELHIDLTPFLPNIEEYDIQTSYDPTIGELQLELYKDGDIVSVSTINGIVTQENFKHWLDNSMEEEVISRVLSDNTIKGLGTKDQLLGIHPLYINGQLRPAKEYIDITTEGSELPMDASVGDTYLVKDYSDEYGKLYPYSAIKKIQLDLDTEAYEQFSRYSGDTTNIGWRIPCAQDFDDMLNAVELEYAKSIGCVEYDESGVCHSTLDTYPTYTHTSDSFIGYALGYIAGRLLKSTSYWSGNTENKGWQVETEYIGTDSYGFKAEPVGYAMVDGVLLNHGKENSIWIGGVGANFSPTNLLHQYDYIQFFGLGNAKAKSFISGGESNPQSANLVRTDLTSMDSYRSIRLVKEYNGGNYHERENILGRGYSTILLPSLTAETGYKIWTVENFDIDYKLENGTYKYGSRPTINDMLSDSDKFANFYLAVKTENNYEYRKMLNGDSIVIEQPISEDDNEFDEYRLVHGRLINKTTDEYKIYNRIADVEQNLEQLKRDSIKSFICAWGAIDNVTTLAKDNAFSISSLTDNILDLGEALNQLSDSTQESIDNLSVDIDDLCQVVHDIQTSDTFEIISAHVVTLNNEIQRLAHTEQLDYEQLENRLLEVDERIADLSGVVDTKITELQNTICNLANNLSLAKIYSETNIPKLDSRVRALEQEVQDTNADERLTTIEGLLRQHKDEGEAVSLEYIERLIDTKASAHDLRKITINHKVVASEGNGITHSNCGTNVNYDFNTDALAFEPLTSQTFTLSAKTPFNVGGIACGTQLSELSGINLSILLQNILFPIVYPTIYKFPNITLTNVEPLLSAEIEGEVEKDGCYVHKDYVVVELGSHFHKRTVPLYYEPLDEEEVGYYVNGKAYIEADYKPITTDQAITNGLSGVSYFIKKTAYNSNVVYPNEIQNSNTYSNLENNVWFDTIGEISIFAEGHFKESIEPIRDSNGSVTDNVYVNNEEGKKELTTLTELKNQSAGIRYNFYFRKSNELTAYVSVPMFLINGDNLERSLEGAFSSSNTPLYYQGWKKGFEMGSNGYAIPKNGVGSIIGMQKWGVMNAEFNIVSDFVSLQFGILSPIELGHISMKAFDTNTADNNQVSNFVSKDALLDETYAYYANHQDEWLNRNIPNGFVRFDYPIYIAFEHWDNCDEITICAYYLYVWVGGAQVPTKFKVATKNPYADTQDLEEDFS